MDPDLYFERRQTCCCPYWVTFPPHQNVSKYKNTKVIGTLLKLNDATVIGVTILSVIYNIYSTYLIQNNYLYCFKIYAHFSLIDKCIRNKFYR
jgi:hypothetical protein